ncbi:MAG: GHMP kinase, partial [Clostridia bacterium]|nr:GHMP kinase [Clostridia bacterium]
MRCIEVYKEIYGREPDGIAFCPYRICPIGAHSDHQHGKITGLAIDKGIHIAYRPKKNGVIELSSLQFDKRAQFHVSGVPKEKENDWADYLRGATIALGKRYPLQTGLSGVIEGSLPIGGLSSSAAVIIAFLGALATVNGLTLSDSELIHTALDAENKYVGVSCGKLDQSCEVYSKKNHLLYLDTLDDSYELIPTHPAMPDYKIAIFFSGIER